MPNRKTAQPQANQREMFWKEERVAIIERNVDGAARFEGSQLEVMRRHGRRLSFLVTCMDERCALVEDRLNLLPNEAKVFSSAGGRIEPQTFIDFFGDMIDRTGRLKRQAAVYLVSHHCQHQAELGCAEFAPAGLDGQTAYLTELQQALRQRFDLAFVHSMYLETCLGQIFPIDTDQRDDKFVQLITGQANLIERPPKHQERSGYGIYVGDAYRAWINEDNAYARLAALNPNLSDDIRASVKAITEGGQVDLKKQPIVLHLDYPIYPNFNHTGQCRRHIEGHEQACLEDAGLKPMIDDGRLKIMRTETEMDSWVGMDIS